MKTVKLTFPIKKKNVGESTPTTGYCHAEAVFEKG